MTVAVSPTSDPLGRNITRLYAFQALVNASLWMPIWVVFLNENAGLTLSQVFLIAGMAG